MDSPTAVTAVKAVRWSSVAAYTDSSTVQVVLRPAYPLGKTVSSVTYSRSLDEIGIQELNL